MLSVGRPPQSASSRGKWLRYAPEPEALRLLHGRIGSEIVRAVGEMKGPEPARFLEAEGLEMLHSVIDPLDLRGIRDRVLGELRGELLKMAVHVGRSVMAWDDEFYVDDYLILRINLPYEIAKNAGAAAENPGIGRVTPSVRDAAAARRVIDPVYDPKGYHRGHPPASWAHGAHIDSWTGHSKDGLNVWWAIGDVPADAGMVLYPELSGVDLACDRRTLYLQSGYRLPVPTSVPLAAGEMIVFDPEILHGTHLNVTAKTRIAVSARLNAAAPTFDPACFYAREFWRRASDIEAGDFDTVLHLKREDHLAEPAPPAPAAPPSSVRVVHPRPGTDPSVAVAPSSSLAEGDRIVASLRDRRIMIVRSCGRLYATDAACPHYGIDLSDGGVDATTAYCPGCALGFDLETGRSAAPSLTLTTYAVTEDDGTIRLELSQ